MKILQNKAFFAHAKRSASRNLIFDLWRCLNRPIFYGLVLEGSVPWDVVNELALTCVIFSLISSNFIPMSMLEKHKIIWSIMNAEFV